MEIEERKYRLFQYAVNCTFGTLWQVKEKFWYKKYPGYNSTREWHPGLSLWRDLDDDTISPAIPMLFGTSKKARSGFCVKGVTEARGEEHETWFGVIEKPIPTASIGDFFGEDPLITRNEHKPGLTKEELEKAERFIESISKGEDGYEK